MGAAVRWAARLSTWAGSQLSRRYRREAILLAVIMLLTIGFWEMVLRTIDFRELRDGYGRGYPVVFQHDAELGWFPIPNSVAQFQGSRTINVAHNSIGLR